MKSPVSHESVRRQFLQGGRLCGVVMAAAMALALAPAGASAASPTLEFLAPGHSLPVSFTTESGAVTAEMAGFEDLVHCTASQGEGEITGPRSTVSKYRFTGCVAGGSEKCKSEGANEEEITTGPIDGDLVYIDQAKQQVGILLNPGGGTYMSFECGGESAEGQGAFLAPGSPINREATSFTATLSQLDSVQTPDEYENEKGEPLQAIPTGKRGSQKLVPTGVEAVFTIHPSVPIEVKVVTKQEIEAKQREAEEAVQLEEEATRREGEATAREKEATQHEGEIKQLQAAVKTQEEALKKSEEHAKQVGEEVKKYEEEATARVAAEAKKRQEEEAAAKKKREEAKKTEPKHPPRSYLLARALRECKKQPKSRRAQCVASAHKRYGSRR